MSDSESITSSEYDESDTDSVPADYTTITGSPQEICFKVLAHFDNKFIPEKIITGKNYDTILQTPESVFASVKSWGSSIQYVNDEFITYELCDEAIHNDNHSIYNIKQHLLTADEYYKLCLQAVSDNGWTIKHIPKEIQTQELVDAAIEGSCWAIQYCLDEYKTYNNCLSAVRRNGQTMKFVPVHFINTQMCELAAQSRYPCLDIIPEEFLTAEICKMAVAGDGKNVKWVPDALMSTDLAYLAITSPAPSNPSSDMAGSNIQYIKAQFLTKEIILESVKRWYNTYGRIPKEAITEEIEEAALDISPHCIRHMKQTPERCMKAFMANPSILMWDCIALENITREMVQHLESLDKQTKKYIKKFIKKEDLDYIMSLL